MKIRKTLHATLAIWTCIGLAIPRAAVGNESPGQAPQVKPIAIAPRILDVALHRNGELQGAVVDSNGRPVEGAPVLIGRFGKPIAELRTDPQGRFVVGGLEGGIYQVVSHGAAQHCRVWPAGTAPATAKQGVIHVTEPAVARGAGTSRLHSIFANPLFAIAVVAASVAIPIATEDDDAS
ncbi:hypothetical protein EC9_47730 [Rosistilla ulvae]|uniref:Nickel uptake substrate-specific transmembrane region n=1 Tax=Rosistilla ulvae TaxID=1930277 RepID=A0A517M6Q4_9BACT|nr:carboxypeptidase-like regulatory domain-containing protein [Rosistilla ulvae]QDS90559.1 hypothetical protein EC9_47730 [Rosistilla ulvae]